MKEINVVCAVIFNSSGQVLIAQRQEPAHLRGLWEFPGGKVEDGEDVEGALHREIEEELAIKIKLVRCIGQFPFDATSFRMNLLAFEAKAINEDFQILDHLDVRWVWPNDLQNYRLSPADDPVFPALLTLNRKSV